MKRVLALVVLAVVALLGETAHAVTTPDLRTAVHGADVSWPNCPKGMGIPQRPTEGAPMPTASSRFVVLGLTNGPGFTPNPCLVSQIRWVRARHLWLGAYSVVSYPTAAQLQRYGGSGSLATRLFRVGVAQARTNAVNLRHAGVARVPMVWVDVEPVRGWPWSTRATANNAVLDGVLAEYRALGIRVGIYSYRTGWQEITGGRRLPSLPTWVPLSSCGKASFSGGPVWMTQTTSGSADLDVTCPGRVSFPAAFTP